MKTKTMIVDTNHSPGARLAGVPIDRIDLHTGFWLERFELNHSVSLRDLWDLLADPDAGHVLSNFRIAAGLETGDFAGTDWQDAWLYKWLEAAAVTFRLTGDAWIEERMDEGIHLIGKAQAQDGYVATQVLARKGERFADPRKHEVYTMGHLLTAGVVHRRMTGKNTFFVIAEQVGRFLHSVLGVTVNPAFAHNPSAVMGLVELYRETRDDRFLDTARVIVDSRGKSPAGRGRDLWHRDDGILGTDLIQDRTPLREADSVVGHNVFFTYLFSGAADVNLESPDDSIWSALRRMWTDLACRKMTLNGGVSPMGHGLSESGDIVVESVGKPYFLPHEDSYNETCGQIGNLMWNYRMLCAQPEGRYADMMEHEIYNSILSGVDLAGENYWYRNQLRFREDHVAHGHNDLVKREKPGRRRICCPTNVVRTIAEWRGYLFGTDDEGVWFHQYAACIASLTIGDDLDIELSVETEYPWSGAITIRIDSDSEKELRLVFRIPGWVSEATFTVNGAIAETSPVTPGYAGITRTWKAGDTIEVLFPMKPRLIEANPRVEQCVNQIAVMRGPILYCLESVDLSEGVAFDDILLPSDIELEPESTDMPFGTTTLTGRALVRRRDMQDGERIEKRGTVWGCDLYRELRPASLEPISIRLIPYYAWANRGKGSMSVWLPVIWR